MSNKSFEKGIEFAYKNLHKIPLHPGHIRAYSTKAEDTDSFISGYLKVVRTIKTQDGQPVPVSYTG